MFNLLSIRTLSTLVFAILAFSVAAQNDPLKSFFNQRVKEYNDNEPLEAKSDSFSIDPKLKETVSEDSMLLSNEYVDSGQLHAIDTISFIKRSNAVKKRRPKQDYKNESQWSKHYRITQAETYKEEHILDDSYRVFGWHPYWMGTAYQDYNYSLLSTIAYFSYELNPNTGGYRTIHDWKSTSMIDSAKAHGTNVLLSVTNFGKENNRVFLASTKAQREFIKILISLLEERGANGVNIDFESIPSDQKGNFTAFIIQLHNELKKTDKNYQVTLAIPPIDYSSVYEFKVLNSYIDLFVIMGYEFYGANSNEAGPVSPVGSGNVWWDYNLQGVLDEYSAEGIALDKTLMGLPYYGAEWKTESLKFPSKAKSFVKYPMYRDIIKKYGKLPCCEEKGSMSKYYVYRDSNDEYRQLWYDDSLSLSKKYDWVKEKGLAGVGIWALGYDNGHSELWKLLAAKFAYSGMEENSARFSKFFGRYSPRRLLMLLMRVIKDPTYLTRNPRPLLSLFGAISGLSLIGFFFIYRYGYRISRTFNVALKGTVTLLVLLMVGLVFLAMKFSVGGQLLYLSIGFLLGGAIIMWLSRNFLKEKELP
ncbi:glycosyl hydrolase family 18 protein [Reichenbachiella versicolor]|uniref:glycosyl hydrolase family 18 protein n=1 Tax=Reichenbachiella versicolor TaxID=1821036 RepID=UPI000D6EA837|nr:glycosyl hydrolase family 18 protein [Reichenbachiella versicolor]